MLRVPGAGVPFDFFDLLDAIGSLGGLIGRGRRGEAWSSAANVLLGTVQQQAGRRILEGRSHGVAVRLVGERGRTHAEARLPLDLGLRLGVRERTSTDQWIWAPGVPIGDAAYDAQWVVESAMPALARAWLVPTVRAALAGSGSSFGIADGLAVATTLTAVDDAVRLVALAHAAIALARGGVLLRERWQTVAAALGGALADEAPLLASVRTADGAITFAGDVVVGATVVRAPAAALAAAADPGELSLARLEAMLGPAHLAAARVARPAVVSGGGGELRAVLPTLDADGERWQATVRVLAALAHGDAYR